MNKCQVCGGVIDNRTKRKGGQLEPSKHAGTDPAWMHDTCGRVERHEKRHAVALAKKVIGPKATVQVGIGGWKFVGWVNRVGLFAFNVIRADGPTWTSVIKQLE